MPAPLEVLWAVVVPLMMAVGAWGVWWWLGAGRVRTADGVAVVGYGVAFLFGFFAIEARGSFPPDLASKWLFYSAVPLTLLAVGEAITQPRRLWLKVVFWVVMALVVIVPLTSGWRNLPTMNEAGEMVPKFTAAQAWGAVGGWVVAVMALRVSVGKMGCASPMSAVWVLGVSSALTAVLLGLSGSQLVMPFRMGALGLGLFPLLAALWVMRGGERRFPAGVLSVWAALYGGLLLCGYLYYEVTVLSGVLVLAGPVVGAGLAWVLPMGRYPGWSRVGVVVGALVPVVVAVGLAVRAFMAAESSGY